MNSFKQDEKAPKLGIDTHKTENAPKQEVKNEAVKPGSDVPSLVEKVENSHKNESHTNAVQSEKK